MMRPAHDHPTFKWPESDASHFERSALALASLHAAKMGIHVVRSNHAGELNHPVCIIGWRHIHGAHLFGCFMILAWVELRVIRIWTHEMHIVLMHVANFVSEWNGHCCHYRKSHASHGGSTTPCYMANV